VSAFAKRRQLRRDLLVIAAVSKSSLTSLDADTPIRRPAHTLPQPPAIFIATLWAGASWLFFLRRGGSTRMTQIWVLYRQSGSDRLEKQPTDLRQYTCYFGERTLAFRPL
jgi:hypothetical protein